MSVDFKMSRNDMNFYLNELAKMLKKSDGKSFEAEIIIVGGGAIMSNYSFRQMTADIDAIIRANARIKDVIYKIADMYELPSDWLNSDFMRTNSYSPKLAQVSKYYRSFCNGILTVRVIDAEYLIAMKLRSFRPYKKDLQEAVGIIGEHIKKDSPIDKQSIIVAYKELYNEDISADASDFLEKVFSSKSIEQLYSEINDYETSNKEHLVKFEENYPNVLNEDNLDEIIDLLQKKENKQVIQSSNSEPEPDDDIDI